MTCRHAAGDPSCSSSPEGRDRAEAERYSYEAEQREKARQVLVKKKEKEEAELYAKTPDKERYEIVGFTRIGRHLVLKVLYPNCVKCSYEGNKVMVFLNVTEEDVVRWRVIDPHFRERTPQQNAPREAPGPAARFPATTEGWQDAINYATNKK